MWAKAPNQTGIAPRASSTVPRALAERTFAAGTGRSAWHMDKCSTRPQTTLLSGPNGEGPVVKQKARQLLDVLVVLGSGMGTNVLVCRCVGVSGSEGAAAVSVRFPFFFGMREGWPSPSKAPEL